MAEDFRTIKEKKAEGTPFTNGLFFGLLLGILISIAVTLFITNGKSPFISKETIGSCIEVNSAIGEEDVINIDEDTTFDFYQNCLELAGEKVVGTRKRVLGGKKKIILNIF